ncbi:MAG: Peptidyl-prolyl cis-trans isomerase fpr2 [Cirrosporium novae-zelandiae]|nr:MAG: Peptidyl-prolyl cis-trans isomerase fpr2 [Cirrosporium novae-zelandiae]
MHFPTVSLTLALLASLATTALTETPAGFEIKVDTPVECSRKTQKGDKVDMHYRGRLADTGKEFDASYNRGKPFSFTLGSGQVIKGWDNGLQDMCIGEKRTLTIPPEWGYGQRNVGPIPAGSTLIFDTELIGIAGVKKDEL